MITLVSDVASAYLLLLDFDQQLIISKRTLKTRQEATRILTERFDKGVVAKLDVHQAEIEEETAAVAVPSFERQIVEVEDTPSVRGMIDKVSHLVVVLES